MYKVIWITGQVFYKKTARDVLDHFGNCGRLEGDRVEFIPDGL